MGLQSAAYVAPKCAETSAQSSAPDCGVAQGEPSALERHDGANDHLLDSPGMPAYSARADGRLCTVDTGILQSAKAADRYNDIRKPWRLRTGGDYSDSTLAR